MSEDDFGTISNDEWRERLTEEQYRVTRDGGTERPFSGEYCDSFDDGLYRCVCCGEILFESSAKFASQCGWPSFDRASDDERIERLEDRAGGRTRTEVRCRRCGAHLGHVFEDGPTETGVRYCINSAAIAHEPE